MALPIGTVDSEGRTWMRCIDCGDSKKRPYIAHAFVDRNGNTYCHRCQTSHRLSIDEYIKYILDDDYEFSEDTIWTPKENVTRHNSGRKTLLTKYVGDDSDDDAFAMYDQYGKLIGWHLRKPNKVMHNEGKRGINWPGADDGRTLTSSRAMPLIIAEGPYDITRPDMVTGYGAISYNGMKQLSYHHVDMWPDPDMLDSKYKRAAFVRMMEMVNDNICFVHGLYVSNADPDKATKIKYVSLNEAKLHVKKEAMYA